jgi:lysophospholipase L1-like esterase
LASGQQAGAASLTGTSTDHWYVISNLDVVAPPSSRAIAILGDSITDGRGSTTNGNDRWTDILAERLQADAARNHVAVLNLGIGGNRLTPGGGIGPPGLARFEQQVLGQAGVGWVVVLEGVNDIGGGATAQEISTGYEQLIEQAHALDLPIYGIPILPFAGSGYDEGDNQQDRTLVNDFIRAPGNFDAFLPLDQAVSDGNTPPGIPPELDFQNDRLHLNPAGLELLGSAVDLSLFSP